MSLIQINIIKMADWILQVPFDIFLTIVLDWWENRTNDKAVCIQEFEFDDLCWKGHQYTVWVKKKSTLA